MPVAEFLLKEVDAMLDEGKTFGHDAVIDDGDFTSSSVKGDY